MPRGQRSDDDKSFCTQVNGVSDEPFIMCHVLKEQSSDELEMHQALRFVLVDVSVMKNILANF